MTRNITRLIHANSASYPLPPGWEAHDFTFTDLTITVKLSNGKGEEAVVRMAYAWSPVNGKVFGKTMSFRLEILKASGAGAKKAAQAFFARIKRNDRVYFYNSAEMLRRESLAQHLFQKYIFSPLLDHKLIFAIGAALAFLVLVLNFREIRDYLMPGKVSTLVALMLIVVLGMALRLYVSPSTPIHCNTHGIREARMFLSLRNDLKAEADYGRVYPLTIRWILGFIGPEEKNLFLLNQILGTLSILAIFMFAKGLLGSDAAGVFSALFFSLSPAQVWMAGTESQIPMYQFISLAGLAFLCVSMRSKSARVLWLATIMISFASSLRILTPLVVPVAAATGIYLGIRIKKGERDIFSKHLAVCLVFAASWAAFHYLSIPNMTGKGWSETSPLITVRDFFFNRRTIAGNTILDPTLTPFIVPLTAAAAFYYSWKKDRRFAIFITAVFLIAVPITFSVLDCRTTAVRYQTQGHWVYYILASALFSRIGPEIFRKRRVEAAAAVAILAFVGAVPGLAMLLKGDEEINEYRFIRETALKIPQKTVIRLPVDYAAGGRLITDYPDYINNHIVVKGNAPALKGSRELIYVGLDCYRYGSIKEKKEDIFPDGKRKQCVNICSTRLAPLYEKKLDASRPTIGYQDRFYELGSSNPVVGFYECIPDEK
ncbi:MAG: hypothetical protein WCX65_07075 [bacterium]